MRGGHADTGPVPLGRPIANAHIYVLGEGGALEPPGVVGELAIGGAGVGRGYFARPDLTAERFIPDPFSQEAGARLYRTGDLGRLRPDGLLDFLGRADSQVKVRGFRVELGEVEVTLGSHPDVREVAVVQEAGGERRLIAYVVLAPGRALPKLAAYAKDALPSAMLPSAFVVVDALPRTAGGKLDRRALASRTPSTATAAPAASAPRNDVEQVLALSWRDLLGVSALGVDDDFFELGGNSLLAIRAIARMREYFRVELGLRDLLQAPTIAGVAARLLAHPEERTRVEEAARVVLSVLALGEDEAARRLAELRDQRP
jgi:hypothetical protein